MTKEQTNKQTENKTGKDELGIGLEKRTSLHLSLLPQLYLRETIEHGPLPGQHCYKFAITKADKGELLRDILGGEWGRGNGWIDVETATRE